MSIFLEKKYIRIILKCLYFILTVLLLSCIAFYNKFPLLYPDSGNYLTNSISLTPSVDKVIGYSFFIRITTWEANVWTIVLFQNLIVSYLVFRFLSLFFSNKKLYIYHFTSLVVLVFFSSLCWFSCLIMPDIFTPVLVILFVIFLIQKKLNYVDFIVYTLLVFLCLITHMSNVFLLLMLLISIFVVFIFKKPEPAVFVKIKIRSLILFITAVLSVLFIMTYNYSHGRGFKTLGSSNILLTAKFNNTGLLKMYLDDICVSNEECVLCTYKDSLPASSDEFLWSNRSPLYNYEEPKEVDKPWVKANEEYAPVVKGIVITPKYYPKIFKDIIKYTGLQLISFKVGTGKIPFGINSAPYYPIRDHFESELPAFFKSLQNNGKLRFETSENIIKVTFVISLVLIIFGLFFIKSGYTLTFSTIVFFLSLLYNAFITSTLSVVEDRYQSRMIWIVPLLAVIYIINIIYKLRGKKQKTGLPE